METWTDQRVEQLKRLWTDGLSASQIAGALGGITRNAVIGKVHRLGLSGRAKAPSSAAPRPRRPRAPSHPLSGGGGGGSFRVHGNTALARLPDPEPDPMPRIAIVPEIEPLACERVTILELRECMCRWPIGDPGRDDFRFCGAHTNSGSSYCPHHVSKAYQPASDRRRERRASY